jgi:hypothetical protein
MSKIALSACVALMVVSSLPAQPPEMPAPVEEHKWLTQLVGEWDIEGEIPAGPDQPAIKCKGVETVRDIGGFWVISESKSTIMDMPVTGILTIGYDPQRKQYVGTWVDSMTSYLWKYEGAVDDQGKTLTLMTEGPSHSDPAKMAKYKEVIELVSDDHKTFTSYVQADDGAWQTIVSFQYHRKK